MSGVRSQLSGDRGQGSEKSLKTLDRDQLGFRIADDPKRSWLKTDPCKLIPGKGRRQDQGQESGDRSQKEKGKTEQKAEEQGSGVRIKGRRQEAEVRMRPRSKTRIRTEGERQEAKKQAEEKKLNFILTDGPPGVGCPVIASIGGANAVLIVTEPTISGMHDMVRVAELANHFKVPGMICVNKFDLNPAESDNIEHVAVEKGLKVLERIPFDPVFIRSMVQGQTIFEYNTVSEAGEAVKKIWEKTSEILEINQ